MKKIIISNKAVLKLKARFLWVYKNEISSFTNDIKDGEIVEIYSKRGEFLAKGYINLKSQIAIRVLTFQKEEINFEFFFKKIQKAFKKRQLIAQTTNSFRAIFSEADFLPGLIVDNFDNIFVIQINTLGMEQFRSFLIKALIQLNPKAIYEKSDSKSRQIEGLSTNEGFIYKSAPYLVTIKENSVKFALDLKNSQKTGFYLDQRANRKIVASYVNKDFQVLDLFSNTGGFGIYAGIAGAKFIKFVDISPNALNLIEHNCKLNNIKNYEIVEANVFDFLKKEKKRKIKYDLIIVDPPSFAKSKKELKGALRGFKYLLLQSIELLKENGYIALFSCSHHIGLDALKEVTIEAARDKKVSLEVIEHLFQDKDHPYILNISNSLYLSGLLLQKV